MQEMNRIIHREPDSDTAYHNGDVIKGHTDQLHESDAD